MIAVQEAFRVINSEAEKIQEAGGILANEVSSDQVVYLTILEKNIGDNEGRDRENYKL